MNILYVLTGKPSPKQMIVRCSLAAIGLWLGVPAAIRLLRAFGNWS